VELIIVEKDGHGFGLGRVPESARWKQAFLAWLDRTLMLRSNTSQSAIKEKRIKKTLTPSTQRPPRRELSVQHPFLEFHSLCTFNPKKLN